MKTLPLKKIILKQQGEKPKQLSTGFISDNLPYLTIEAIEKGEIKQYADWYSPIQSTEEDIFVVRTGARNGLILKGKNGAVGSTLFCITPLWVDKGYLYYFLKLNEFQNSGGRDLINTFWDIPVPIISLEKQKQIANNIKEALSVFEQQNKEAELNLVKSLKSLINIDSDMLESIQNLDDLKKGVLDLALNGKLTENWRNQHYQSHQDKKWKEVVLASILKSIESGKSFKCEERPPKTNEIGVVKTSAISSGTYNENESKTCIDSKFFNPSILIKKGDFLFSRANTVELVGACVVVENVSKSIMLSDKILRLNFLEGNPKYIQFVLQSRFGRNQIEKFATGNQESMKNISQENIKNIKIPLPTQLEQEEIVKLVNVIFEKSEDINKIYRNETVKQEELQKSILSSFYKDLVFDGDIKDILSKIEIARTKKNTEITTLKTKQKQFREKLSTLPKMEIIELLKSSDNQMFINDLWIKSKYNGNIDAFYEALKQEFESNSIKWTLTEQDSDVPQSQISLNPQSV